MSREEIIAEMKNQLDRWNADMEAMDEKIGQVGDKLDGKFKEQKAVLKDRYKELQKKMSEVQDSADDKFDNAKGEIDKFFTAFRDSVEEFKSHYKK